MLMLYLVLNILGKKESFIFMQIMTIESNKNMTNILPRKKIRLAIPNRREIGLYRYVIILSLQPVQGQGPLCSRRSYFIVCSKVITVSKPIPNDWA